MVWPKEHTLTSGVYEYCIEIGVGDGTTNSFVLTAKGRTNFDLRDTLSPEGQTTFRSRKGSGTYGLKSKLNDTGYASSVSSGINTAYSRVVLS